MSDVSINFSESINMIGTIKSINTFASKGGGISIGVESSDLNVFSSLVYAKTNICRFVFKTIAIDVSGEEICAEVLKQTVFEGTIKSPVLKQKNKTIEFKIESSSDDVAGSLPGNGHKSCEIAFIKISISVSSARISEVSKIDEVPQLPFEDESDQTDDIIEEITEEEDSVIEYDDTSEYEEYEEVEDIIDEMEET